MNRRSRWILVTALAGATAACGAPPPQDHYWSSQQCEVSLPGSGTLPFTPSHCEAYLRRTEGASVLILHVDSLDAGIGNAYPGGPALSVLIAPKQPAKSVAKLSHHAATFPGASVVEVGTAQVLFTDTISADSRGGAQELPWSSARGSIQVVAYTLKERNHGHDELIDLDVQVDLSAAVIEPSSGDAQEVPLLGSIRLRASDRRIDPSDGAGGTSGSGAGGTGGQDNPPSSGGGNAPTAGGEGLSGGAGAEGNSLCPVRCGAPGCNDPLGACNGEQVLPVDTVALCEGAGVVGILDASGTFSKLAAGAAAPAAVFAGPIVDQTARCVVSGDDAYVATATSLSWASAPPATVYPYGVLLGATATHGYFAAVEGAVLEVRRFAKPHAMSEAVACAEPSAGVGAVSEAGTVYLARGNSIVSYDAAAATTCKAAASGTPFTQVGGPVLGLVYDAGRLVVAETSSTMTFDVLSIDIATTTPTQLGTASAFNSKPLAALAGATFFVEAAGSGGVHRIVEVADGITRPLGVAQGTVSALAATTTHIYWSLLQGGVFRAPR